MKITFYSDRAHARRERSGASGAQALVGEDRAQCHVECARDELRLARKVKGLREKKKMSQVELAALAGTKQPNIARLESGKVVPRLDFLEKVARALGGHLDVRIVERKSNA